MSTARLPGSLALIAASWRFARRRPLARLRMTSPVSNVRPKPDQVLVDIADYVTGLQGHRQGSLRHGAILPAGHAGLRSGSAVVSGVHQAAGPDRSGHHRPQRRQGAGHAVSARSGASRIQHRRHDAAGSISTTPGWRRNGVTLPTTSAASSPSPTGCRATPLPPAESRLTVRDVLTAMIKAHEIQGVIALENSFNRVGPGSRRAGQGRVDRGRRGRCSACRGMKSSTPLSLAWVDGQSLRTYRHSPNTGSRKSWAAGDATARAVRLALMVVKGEMGYPSVLTRQDMGLLRRPVQGQAVQVPAPLRQLRHGKRAVQDQLPGRVPRPDRSRMRDDAPSQVVDRIADIRKITLRTQESAIRIIDKKGPLANPADRDHCIQYMVAVPLIHGRLTAAGLRGQRRQRSPHRSLAR